MYTCVWGMRSFHTLMHTGLHKYVKLCTWAHERPRITRPYMHIHTCIYAHFTHICKTVQNR